MLTAAEFDSLVDPITSLYNDYIDTIIQDMAKRMKSLGSISDTTAWQFQKVIESGALYDETLKEIAKLTGKSEKLLAKQFAKAGVTSLRFDDKIYTEAGLKVLPLNLSPAMKDVLLAGVKKTNNVMNNMTLTTAFDARNKFINSLDIAYLQVTSGTMDYNSAIRQAIKSVGSSGLEVLYPTGHVDKLDVATRRAVLTGTAQTTHQLQWERANELDADLVQVSAHGGARPSHALWQGKIYSRSGKSKQYPEFVSSTGYGTGEGLGGYNCRHSWYPYFKGISAGVYNQKMLNDVSNQYVTYNGQRVSLYDATQIQRSIERKIREWKRQANALDAASLENSFESGKVAEWQARMRDFINQTKLDRQYVREQV